MKKIALIKQTKTKTQKTLYRTFGLLLTVFIVFLFIGEFFTPIIKKLPLSAEEPETTSSDLQNGVVRPEEIEEGLSRKSFKDMEGRRVTVRQPYMEVLDRNVKRQNPETLDDVFAFIDPDTKEPYIGEGAEIAKIDFAAEGKPNNEIGNSAAPRYPMQGLDRGEEKYFSNFVKYMLLRQAWYYRTQAIKDIEKNQLKKHPAADFIYGKIDESYNAVTKKIVTDPIYRSPMTTGLYLAPGEVATVKVTGLTEGKTVRLTTHQQDSLGYDGGFEDGFNPNDDPSYRNLNSTERYFRYWDTKLIEEAKNAYKERRDPDYTQFSFNLQGQWKWQNQKVPCMGSIFDISSNGTHKIGSIYGGPLYIQPTDSPVEIEISGAVETPHFILGVTSKQEFEEYLRDAPGLIATLDVENGQLIGLSKYMKQCDDIEKLAYFWHSVFAINASLNGREYNYNVTMAYDLHVPAGEAVALNSSFAAQPYGWFESCMNYETLTTKGNWGTFHELGHIQAKTYGVNWGMCNSTCKSPCEGEVWNNTLIILMYSMLCNMDSRIIQVEHGEFVHPFTAVQRSMSVQNVSDYHDFNNTSGAHFDQLSLYSTLIHSFGPERFVDFFYTYSVNASYCPNSRADFIYRIGLVDHVNIFNWINENYHGNVTIEDFSDEQWEYLGTLPNFYPIAYRWANGIDGNETARKYEVDGKFDTVFDLSEGNIACPKEYSILEVKKPRHGTLVYDAENARITYTPPKSVAEEDGFDIVVTTEDRIVTLNVRFRLIYRGTYAEVWKLSNEGAKQTVEAAITEIGNRAPDRTEESVAPGKANFKTTSDNREYYRLRFKFTATENGRHLFYLRADDAAKVALYTDNENGLKLGELSLSHDTSSYGTNNVAVELDADESVYFDCRLVNWGGPGNLYVGVKFPESESIVDIPSTHIVNAAVNKTELEIADNFEGWQPKFLDSIKNASIDYQTEKVGWRILENPNPQSGNDPQAMVDGNDNTFFHSWWSGAGSPSPKPYKILIDCGSEIVANYFEIFRRSNETDKISAFTLYGAKGEKPSAELTENDFTLLFDGNTSNPGDLRYRVTFDEQNIRYFKLVITNTNANFIVIRELNAGRTVSLNQTVKPKNYEQSKSGFIENASNGKLYAESTDSYYEFEFFGSGFDVFADTAPEYGTAEVFIDGDYSGIITLSDKIIFNKCVFRKSGLKVTDHVVRIVTNSNLKFNISFINVSYDTPVDQEDYPTQGDDYGDSSPIVFSANWRTLIKDYKDLKRIDFAYEAPDGYFDTYKRMNNYIRIYRKNDDINKLAFVYKGKIESPSDCTALFADCLSLEEINFDNFDTASMRGAVSMFNGCGSLKTLDLSKFKTAQTFYMSTMFENCVSLTELDLSGFSIMEQTTLISLFDGCFKLAKLYMPKVIANDIPLPAQFVDHENKKFYNNASSENAGHIMSLHEDHVFAHFELVPADCTTNGIKEHDYCECGIYCIDDVQVDADSLIIPALGHVEKIVPGTDPTCTRPGLTQGSVCSVCGEILKEQNDIPALGHVEKIVPGTDPTCARPGLTQGSVCSVCGEILKEQNDIPALDHEWGDWKVVKEPTETQTGIRERECKYGHVETQNIPPIKKPVNAGLIVGLCCGGAAILLGVGVTFLIILKRKRQNK